MILHFMKCEMCEKQHRFEPRMGPPWSQMPRGWFLLMTGARDEEGCLFCSAECLAKHIGVGVSTEPLEQPQTKMRRFLLVDEDANECQGVQWEHGGVSLDPKNDKDSMWFYRDWEEFKHNHDGCGVTWIDQEVKEEVSSNA